MFSKDKKPPEVDTGDGTFDGALKTSMNKTDKIIFYKGRSVGPTVFNTDHKIVCGKCKNEFKPDNLVRYSCPKCKEEKDV